MQVLERQHLDILWRPENDVWCKSHPRIAYESMQWLFLLIDEVNNSPIQFVMNGVIKSQIVDPR